MKKIDRLTATAFENGRNFRMSNTVVESSDGVTRCYLYGNLIAERSAAGVRFQSCGWNTVTTRARLQACGADCRISVGLLVFRDGSPVPSRF